jgi:hypothetical protein
MEVDGAIQQSDAAVAAIGKGEASLALCNARSAKASYSDRDARLSPVSSGHMPAVAGAPGFDDRAGGTD